jgi:hypothetical protein
MLTGRRDRPHEGAPEREETNMSAENEALAARTLATILSLVARMRACISSAVRY